MTDFIDSIISLYKEDWENYKAQYSYVKKSTSQKVRIARAKVHQITNQNLVYDILDLYEDRQPLWMRLIQYTQRPKVKPTKKLHYYDASIDDDEHSDTSSYLARTESHTNLHSQLDNICAELGELRDDSSSIYGEYNDLVGPNPYNEEYTYIWRTEALIS